MTARPPVRRRHAAAVLADGVRALGLVSVLAAVRFGGVEVALFALVLLGLVLPRFLALPPGLDLATGVTLLAAGWFAAVDLYAVVPWLDLAVHLLATAVLAVVAYVLLARTGGVPALGAARTARVRGGVVVITGALGMALSLLWELGEWFGSTYLDDGINVGYLDTLADMAAGGVGALLAGVVLVLRPGVAGGRVPIGDTASPQRHRQVFQW